MAETGTIRTGIGGWTFDPWKNHFYPEKLKAKDELSYASSKLRAIEVNGTYYSSQKPATFAKWAAEAPEDFVFSLKASRFCTNRRVLAEGGESVMKFVSSGITELGPKARTGPLAVHADEAIRSGRFRRVSVAASERAGRYPTEACCRSSASVFRCAGICGSLEEA